jgi:hypothetical protein
MVGHGRPTGRFIFLLKVLVKTQIILINGRRSCLAYDGNIKFVNVPAADERENWMRSRLCSHGRQPGQRPETMRRSVTLRRLQSYAKANQAFFFQEDLP